MANKLYYLMTFCVLLGGLAVAQGDVIKPVDTISVAIDNKMKPNLTPKYLTTADSWKEFWEAIQPKRTLPPIDFSTHLLLVFVQDFNDTNAITLNLTRDAKGVLKVEYRVTERGFEASKRTKYHFYVIPREGITAIGDTKLPK